jgi:hypothetical protein
LPIPHIARLRAATDKEQDQTGHYTRHTPTPSRHASLRSTGLQATSPLYFYQNHTSTSSWETKKESLIFPSENRIVGRRITVIIPYHAVQARLESVHEGAVDERRYSPAV